MDLLKFALSELAKKGGARFEAPRNGDAGYDLHAPYACPIFPGDLLRIDTGLVVEIPASHVGIVKDRSSMAARGLVVRGGVIDASYRGSITVLLSNTGTKPYDIEPGQRIAQLLIVPIATPSVVEVREFEETERGDKGFGSTGK